MAVYSSLETIDALPKHTIYIKNIYEKIGKQGTGC